MRKVLFLKSISVVSCHNYFSLESNICPEEHKCEKKKSIIFESRVIWGKYFLLSNSSTSMKIIDDLYRTPFPLYVSVN